MVTALKRAAVNKKRWFFFWIGMKFCDTNYGDIHFFQKFSKIGKKRKKFQNFTIYMLLVAQFCDFGSFQYVFDKNECHHNLYRKISCRFKKRNTHFYWLLGILRAENLEKSTFMFKKARKISIFRGFSPVKCLKINKNGCYFF